MNAGAFFSDKAYNLPTAVQSSFSTGHKKMSSDPFWQEYQAMQKHYGEKSSEFFGLANNLISACDDNFTLAKIALEAAIRFRKGEKPPSEDHSDE